jgi:hypothetical protein
MASVTRSNPTAVALGTLQSTLQLKLFKCVLNNSGDAVARTAATAALLTDEIGTTGALMQVKANGLELAFIGDGHALDVDTVAIRLGRIIAAGSRTSSGVFTFTGGGTLTVTSPTTFVGLQA